MVELDDSNFLDPSLAPGSSDAADDYMFRSPPREYFDEPAHYELGYDEEEKVPIDEWQRVQQNGKEFWFNGSTGVSQWDAPPLPKDDDFEGLVKAAKGVICSDESDGGVVLRVIVKPSQEEEDVLDVTTTCAQIALRAPKEDGWCNQGLLAFIRRALHVPQRERNMVRIVDGDLSLDKRIFVPALTSKEVIKRLHKRQEFEVDTNDVEKWIRHTERKQKEEERRMKRRKWA